MKQASESDSDTIVHASTSGDESTMTESSMDRMMKFLMEQAAAD